MTNYKTILQDPVFDLIAQTAQELDQKTFVVGGFVRDVLLKRPSKDIDIVTLGKGIDFARLVAQKLGDNVGVTEYKNFGTALIKYGDYQIEFVGARKESYRRNSRNPIVEEGSLKDDQDRRDFTINSMAFSLNSADFGSLIDPHGGILSIEYKEIKTILDPGKTYSDDPLRMMRAIRFASQLNFTIESDSYQAISKNASRIEIVSKERIIDELNKIILTKTPSRGLNMLHETGILGIIFPEMVALSGVEVINGKAHKDNFLHTLQVLDNISENTDDLWLRWSAILHDIAKPPTKRFDHKTGWTFHGHEDLGAKMVPEIFRKLKLPLDQKMKYVQKMVRLHLRPIALVKETVTDSAIRRLLFEGGDDVDDLMILCQADITTQNKDKQKRYADNFKKVKKKLKEVEEKDHLKSWQPPVTGQMIMEAFNLEPCKEVGLIKNTIREAILEGEITNNHEEAFKLMISEGRKLGLNPVDEALK
ncbi:MAG TPA: tRNA nucleotidyltransferase [Flavobacteriales bacterium]|nr:tRNA nucleotidyltransferase [Flavobacteriales bacterium]